MDFRVGLGYDVHAWEAGKPLKLGGLEIPFEYGLKGHSDGDALIHAICDAMLGAANLRDIGHHFPDTDPQWKGVDSARLLQEVHQLLDKNGWQLGNLDATICTELPKINPYIPEMKSRLAHLLEVDENRVSLKATTSEKMGFVGRQEGLACYTVAGIFKKA